MVPCARHSAWFKELYNICGYLVRWVHFAEIVNRTPLFAGQNDLDQLTKIFQIRGTPNMDDWPGLTELPLYEQHMAQMGQY